MDEQTLRAAEQSARLARIRAKIREGVWTLRDNSALQAHWEALEREMRADNALPEAGEPVGITAGSAMG